MAKNSVHYKESFIVTMIVAAMVFAQGCATPALLDTVNPSQKVQVSVNDTSEEELQQKGRSYSKHETWDYYMVEKSPWRKAGDYALLGIGLPVAVVADGVIGVTVGVVVIAAAVGPQPFADAGNYFLNR